MTYTHQIWNWNYRTGAFSVREQKRLMTSPHGDTAHKEYSYSTATNYAHLWEYNMVGVGGEELIRYQGFQTASTLAGANGRRVYIAPYQYIVPGGEVRITSDTNIKEIYITDHLGSVRCIVGASLTMKQFDYDPFGAYISKPFPDTTRDGFTSAASDIEEGESNLMQMGVRMYSARIGRFLSVDPLHELMPSHNPYHYAFNSPLVWKDPSGLAPEKDKNIHSEKLQGQFIKLRDLSTPIMPGDEYWVYFKDDRDFYFSAEYDAGFADRPVWAMPSLGGGGSGGGVGSGRSSRSTQANGPRTYDPYNINESSSPGGKSGLDVSEIRRRTKKYSDDLVKQYKDHKYKNVEIGYNYYYNVNDGEIYAEFFEGVAHSMSLNFRSFVYKYEDGYKLIAFEHTHTLNQPLEPLDFNSLGYNIQLLTTPGPNPINPWRQFIYFCTTVAEKNNPKTTYGYIYDSKMFENWYNDNYTRTNFNNFFTDKSIEPYFLNGQYFEAIKAFQGLLKKSGVKYDTIE